MSLEVDRFLEAQEPIYAQVLQELASGRKNSHWMWFIFPQLQGLGQSSMAHYYGLEDLAAAQAYQDHPILGTRLRECCDLLLNHKQLTAHQIFGSPDDLKLCSCITLFARTYHQYDGYLAIINRFYQGQLDERTLHLIAA